MRTPASSCWKKAHKPILPRLWVYFSLQEGCCFIARLSQDCPNIQATQIMCQIWPIKAAHICTVHPDAQSYSRQPLRQTGRVWLCVSSTPSSSLDELPSWNTNPRTFWWHHIFKPYSSTVLISFTITPADIIIHSEPQINGHITAMKPLSSKPQYGRKKTHDIQYPIN